MGLRFLGAALLFSLIASDAFAAQFVIMNCPYRRIAPAWPLGLRATMQIEVPSDSGEILRTSLRSYAASHDLFFQSQGYDQTRDRSRAILIGTKLRGVVIKIEAPEGLAAADVEIHTTCFAEEAWQSHWSELKDFEATSNYRILSVNDSAGGAAPARNSDSIDIRPFLSPTPLGPIDTQQ